MKLPSATAFALLIATVVALAAACSSGKTAPDPNAVPPGTQYTLSIGPITVQPGEERTQCLVLPLGNPGPIHVNTIHNTLTPGSHHMIVYRSAETVEQTTPFDCQPFTDTLDPSKGSTLMVTQKRDDVLTLPSGVGFALDANQMIRLELHYINPGAQPIQVTATTTLTTMDERQFQSAADFLFIGDPDITLPPNAKTTLGPIFFQLPSEYAGVNFFAITGHEHQLGTDVKVAVASNANDPGTPVYDVPGWLWSEPTTVVANPPFTVPQNGGFRFTCDWNNTTTNTVKFGESANDEMCFFWAYYYPSQGSRVCLHSDRYNGGIDICCPGSNIICSIIQSKLQDAGG